MVKPLFDTNILIDYLRGFPEAEIELDRHAEKAISVITWMEVLIGTQDALEQDTCEFLSGFEIIGGHSSEPRLVAGDAQHQGLPAGRPKYSSAIYARPTELIPRQSR